MDKLEKTQIPAKMLLNPVHCFALGFGSGLVPRIPGTTGTLVGVLLFILMPDMDWITYLVVVVCGFLFLETIYAAIFTFSGLSAN